MVLGLGLFSFIGSSRQASEVRTDGSSEASMIFCGVLSFMWLMYIWETYLTFRQRSVNKSTKKVPSELSSVLDVATFEKAREYQLDKSNFGLVKDIISQIITTLIIWYFGLVYMWDVAGEVVKWQGYDSSYEIVHSLVFLFFVNIFNTIVGLPFAVYGTFVLEEKHGFNKQTPVFFIKDQIKAFVVGNLIMLPIVSGIIYIIKIGGDYFFMYLWLFSMVVMFFLMTIYPEVIAPLFDKYTPLPDGPLRERIEKLAHSIDFPLTKLYVVEGSKRSAHSNAYLYGFFNNKRIVLFDTLIENYSSLVESSANEMKNDISHDSDSEGGKRSKRKSSKKDDSEKNGKDAKKGCTNDEILAVLGHEFGHWKMWHVVKNMVIGQVNLLLVFLVFSFLYHFKPLYIAFGFGHTQPVLIGLIIIMQFIFAPYNELTSFLMTALSRKFEFEADTYAKHLGLTRHLKSALIKLNKDNLSFPVYDWLFSSWHHSHPPLLERLKALDGRKTK